VQRVRLLRLSGFLAATLACGPETRVDNPAVVFDAGIGIHIQTCDDESFAGPDFVENLIVRNTTVFRGRASCISVSGWGSPGRHVAVDIMTGLR
jgi:hypothetical protein